ncbi:MAG: sulfurtransferase-like selenium metabolism protein YedF [Bacillota bacterium]|nr:sulfurtransferase-like selenium metabolism protein YedF [Bacillota bacterium]
MDNIVVNAIGEACPIPVVKTRKALEQMKEPGILEIHVDNAVAVQNLERFAGNRGLQAASEKQDDKHYVVKVRVEELQEARTEEEEDFCVPDKRSDTVVAISSDCMGTGSDELGAALMKGFIYALAQQKELPKAILFYNGGARLTVEGAVSVEDLKGMEARGVEILTCGTCLNFYGLTEKLAVGAVTNMYDIVEKLNGVSKVIKP